MSFQFVHKIEILNSTNMKLNLWIVENIPSFIYDRFNYMASHHTGPKP